MNERIQKLMGKALDSEMRRTWDTMTYGDLLQFSEKFAELIVKECAEFVENDDYRGITLAGRLRLHFGVESE